MGPELLAAELVVLVARLLSGITRFGFALLAAPPLMLFYKQATVVTSVVVLAHSTAWFQLIGTMPHVQAFSSPHCCRPRSSVLPRIDAWSAGSREPHSAVLSRDCR